MKYVVEWDRSDIVNAVSDAMQDVHDMDTNFGDYAEAAVDWFAQHWREIRLTMQADPHAPCSSCGKPWNTKSCSMGGCPLGADI